MTLSLAAVFLPLVFMEGIIGRIFREFAVVIVVSIIASGVVSLTLTPLMCARAIGARGHGTKKSFVERVIGGIEHRVLRVYGASLWFFLRHRWVSALVWVVCLAGTAYFAIKLPKSFLPVGDSSFAMGVLIGPEGASPTQMRNYQTQAESIMHENPAVDMTFTMTGLGQFIGSNQGFLIAFLQDPKERKPLQTMGMDGKMKTIEHPAITDITGAMMGQLMMRMRGVIGVMTPQPVLEISTGATSKQGGQFAYTISGVDPNEVYAASGKMMQRLQAEQGKLFASVLSDLYMNTPQLRINILREKASTYGVSATSIEALLRNAYSQNYVYLVKRADDQQQVILEVSDTMRNRPEDLGLLYVRSDDGKNLVPLSAVATWEPTLGPQSVNHLNQFTSVTFNFNLTPGVPIGNATKAVEQIAREILPSHLRGEFQGEALTFQQTLKSLSILMVIAIFVMYVILAILYESYIHPITVLSTLPTALVGGLATLWLFNEEASLYAFIGLFMLMGIVKKNGIMIVDFALQRVAAGETAERAIHDASMDRFRPILMTTLAAVMGAVPIALGWGADGGTRRPLGLVIVGGLLVSQLITLYVTPVIYLYLELFQEHVLDRTTFFRSARAAHAHDAAMESRLAETGVEESAAIVASGNGNGHSDHTGHR